MKETTITVRDLVEGGIPLGAAVQAVLARRDMTLGAWCKAVGHSPSSVSRLFSDERVRYDDIRAALCRAFDLDRAWLDDRLAK